MLSSWKKIPQIKRHAIVGAIICLGMLIYSFFAVDFFIFFFGTSFSLSSIIFSYTDAISSISPNAINFP